MFVCLCVYYFGFGFSLHRFVSTKNLPCFCPGSSLKESFGKHEVDMSAMGVLAYLKGLQREHKLRMRDVIHDDVELGLKLCGRKAADDVMVAVFRQRYESLRTQPQPVDRMLYPMVGWCAAG